MPSMWYTRLEDTLTSDSLPISTDPKAIWSCKNNMYRNSTYVSERKCGPRPPDNRFETTSPPFSLAVVEDSSSNGIIINNTLHSPTEIKGKTLSSRSIILSHGDTISFPRHPEICFKYEQNPACGPNLDKPSVDLFMHTTQSRWSIHGYIVSNIILGAGANGTVYLGTKGSCQVAMKCTKRPTQPETDILAPLTHPNIQNLLDFFPLDNGSIAVLELYTGGDLFAYLDKHGALTEREVRFLAWQLVKGVAYLHDQSVTHRGGFVQGGADEISNRKTSSSRRGVLSPGSFWSTLGKQPRWRR